MNNLDSFDYWVEYLILQSDLDIWEATYEQLLASWDLDLCTRLLSEGKRWAKSLEEKAFVQFWEGRLAAVKGEFERTIKAYKNALKNFPPEHRMVPTLMSELGMTYRLIGDITKALYTHRQMRHLAENQNDPWLMAEVSTQLGLDYEAQGSLKQAAKCFEDALTYFNNLNSQKGVTSVQKHLGLVLWQQGYLEEATTNLLAALDGYEQIEDWYSVAQVKANLGNISTLQNKFEEAVLCYEYALDIFQELDVVFDQVALLNNLGGLALKKGENKLAEAYLQESYKLALSLNNKPGERDALLNFAVLCRREHKWDEVTPLYLEAARITRQMGNQRYMFSILWQMAQFRMLKTLQVILGWLRRQE